MQAVQRHITDRARPATSFCSTYGVGSYYAAEGSLALLPADWRGDQSKVGVIVGHPAGANGTQADDRTNWPNWAALLAAIAGAGFPALSCDLGGNLWGNATGISRLTAAVTYLQGAYPASGLGAKAGGVLLVGLSVGSLQAMNWARQNVGSAKGIVSVLPVSDLNDIVVNNRGGHAAEVNTAYGTYNNGTMGATYNPAVYALTHDLDGIPIQLWYATDDAIVIPSTVTGVTNAISPAPEVHTLTGGHSDTAIGQVNAAQVIAFLQAHS